MAKPKFWSKKKKGKTARPMAKSTTPMNDEEPALPKAVSTAENDDDEEHPRKKVRWGAEREEGDGSHAGENETTDDLACEVGSIDISGFHGHLRFVLIFWILVSAATSNLWSM